MMRSFEERRPIDLRPLLNKPLFLNRAEWKKEIEGGLEHLRAFQIFLQHLFSSHEAYKGMGLTVPESPDQLEV